MLIKLLYIQLSLVFLTIAHTNAEISKFKKEMIKGSLLQVARHKMMRNKDYYKGTLAKRIEKHEETIKSLERGHVYLFKLDRIKKTIANIVTEIERCVIILNAAKSSINNEITPSKEEIIKSFLSIAENAAFFGDIYYSFPKMTAEILRIETEFNEWLDMSLKYTSLIEDLLDESTVAMLSVVKEELYEEPEEPIVKLQLEKISNSFKNPRTMRLEF